MVPGDAVDGGGPGSADPAGVRASAGPDGGAGGHGGRLASMHDWNPGLAASEYGPDVVAAAADVQIQRPTRHLWSPRCRR